MIRDVVQDVQESSCLEEIYTSFHITHTLLFLCMCSLVKEIALELQVLSFKCIQPQSWTLDYNHDQGCWAGCAGKKLP